MRNEFRQIYGDDAPFIPSEADPLPIELPEWGDIALDANAYTRLEEFETDNKRLYDKYMECLVAEFGRKARKNPLRFAGPQRYALQLLEVVEADDGSDDGADEDSGSDGEPVASSSRQTRQKTSKAEQAGSSSSEEDAGQSTKHPRRPSRSIEGPAARMRAPNTAVVPLVDKQDTPVETPAGSPTSGKSGAAKKVMPQWAVPVDNSDLFNEDEDSMDGPPETSTPGDEDPPADAASPITGVADHDADARRSMSRLTSESDMDVDSAMPTQHTSLDVHLSASPAQPTPPSSGVASIIIEPSGDGVSGEGMVPTQLLSDSQTHWPGVLRGPQQHDTPPPEPTSPPPALPSPHAAPAVLDQRLNVASTTGTSCFCYGGVRLAVTR